MPWVITTRDAAAVIAETARVKVNDCLVRTGLPVFIDVEAHICSSTPM
jgi:hypothetical protein